MAEYLLGLFTGLVLGGLGYRSFSRANQTVDKILRMDADRSK